MYPLIGPWVTLDPSKPRPDPPGATPPKGIRREEDTINMKHYNIFDMYECFKCPSWRRLFEQPKLLQGWISFHLWAIHGKRSKEMALLAVYVARRLSSLYRKNGALWTARYLKTCRVSMYKALAGISKNPPYKVLYPAHFAPTGKMIPVSLASFGLPKFILPIHRRLMVSSIERDKWVRTYATIFDIHKLILVDVRPVDVSSIIEEATAPPLSLPPGPVQKPIGFLRYIPETLAYMRTQPLRLGLAPKLFWTAGPSTPPGVGSLACLVEDAQAFLDKHIPLELHLCEVLFLPSERWVGGFKVIQQGLTNQFLSFLIQVVAPRPPLQLRLSCGRVGMKTEPAGKTRLFMILDSITQRLLAPLHKWVYGLLRTIPSDGTFDQLRPLNRLKGTVDTLYSFDLKSATDRVPAEELLSLLQALFGDDVATAWRCLLYRPFVIPPTMSVTPKVSDVIFTTGTPLGSLSAWGVFALFHHLLVQQAAHFHTKVKGWFSDYAILGDDLVIGSPGVARQYNRLLKRIGVKISQEKSLASRNGSMEYASRFVLRGVDLSPVSFRTLAAARESLGALTSFFLRVESFRETRISELFRLRGAGYRTLPYSGMPFWLLHRIPKRWFRVWLSYYHPHGRRPLPWLWWLSAGRKKLIPPEAIGVLHHQLLENWFSRPPWESKDQDKDEVPYWEEVVRYPWFLMHLRLLRETCLSLISGELIDPLLLYIPMKDDLNRQPSQEGSSLSLRKWSLSFRLYDRMTRILSKPLPLLVEAGGSHSTEVSVEQP